MKNILRNTMALTLVSLFLCMGVQAQVVVPVRPQAPKSKVRPVSPGPRFVWVSGEYVWKVSKYIYVPGYWTEPPSRKTRWVNGRWRPRKGGWIWVRGYWR